MLAALLILGVSTSGHSGNGLCVLGGSFCVHESPMRTKQRPTCSLWCPGPSRLSLRSSCCLVLMLSL